MYFSLSELDVAMARHCELVESIDRARLTRDLDRINRAPIQPVRRLTGAALVRLGERLQGAPVPSRPDALQ